MQTYITSPHLPKAEPVTYDKPMPAISGKLLDENQKEINKYIYKIATENNQNEVYYVSDYDKKDYEYNKIKINVYQSMPNLKENSIVVVEDYFVNREEINKNKDKIKHLIIINKFRDFDHLKNTYFPDAIQIKVPKVYT